MTGAAYHKGTSNQDVATPREFLKVVEARFGQIGWDLAATKDNQVVSSYRSYSYYGSKCGLQLKNARSCPLRDFSHSIRSTNIPII